MFLGLLRVYLHKYNEMYDDNVQFTSMRRF